MSSAPKQPSRKPHGSGRGLTDEVDVEFMAREASLANGTWDMADPATFLIRGKRYLRDNKKVVFEINKPLSNDLFNFYMLIRQIGYSPRFSCFLPKNFKESQSNISNSEIALVLWYVFPFCMLHRSQINKIPPVHTRFCWMDQSEDDILEKIMICAGEGRTS